jgi:hypothetical protein
MKNSGLNDVCPNCGKLTEKEFCSKKCEIEWLKDYEEEVNHGETSKREK